MSSICHIDNQLITVFCENCGNKHQVVLDSNLPIEKLRFCEDCLKETIVQCNVCGKEVRTQIGYAKDIVCTDCASKPYQLKSEAINAAKNIISINWNPAIFKYSKLGFWFTESKYISACIDKIQIALRFFEEGQPFPESIRQVLAWKKLCFFEPQVFGDMQQRLKNELLNGLEEDTSLYWENMKILITNCKIEISEGHYHDRYFFKDFPIYNSCYNTIVQHLVY